LSTGIVITFRGFYDESPAPARRTIQSLRGTDEAKPTSDFAPLEIEFGMAA
jgi:hypothetical protein